MNKFHVAALVIASAVSLLTGCASPPTSDTPPNAFSLRSPEFPDNAMLTKKYAGRNKTNPNCVGDNLSPALLWSNAPEKTRSFIILMDDQAGRVGMGVSHWVAYGIPANVSSLAEGAGSAPSKLFIGGRNTPGMDIYLGPCPPPGNAPQHYVFTIIATSVEPDELKPGLTKDQVLAAIKGRNLRAASMVLRYRQ